MSYNGERALPLQLTAASQLYRNRCVKITSGVPAYPGYGETVHGITRADGNEDDYKVSVYPLDFIDTTFFLSCGGTVTANEVVFATGAAGKVKGKTGTVVSRSVKVPTSPSSGDNYIVPNTTALVDDWDDEVGTLVAGDIAAYTSGWAETAVSTGDIYWVKDEGVYVIYSGSAWVTVEPVAYAVQAGVSGDDVACYRYKSMASISWNQLADAHRNVTQSVAAGTVTVASGETAIRLDDDRIAATDYIQATINSSGANDCYVSDIAIAADIATFTVNTDPGTGGAEIFYEVKRVLSNV